MSFIAVSWLETLMSSLITKSKVAKGVPGGFGGEAPGGWLKSDIGRVYSGGRAVASIPGREMAAI